MWLVNPIRKLVLYAHTITFTSYTVEKSCMFTNIQVAIDLFLLSQTGNLPGASTVNPR